MGTDTPEGYFRFCSSWLRNDATAGRPRTPDRARRKGIPEHLAELLDTLESAPRARPDPAHRHRQFAVAFEDATALRAGDRDDADQPVVGPSTTALRTAPLVAHALAHGSPNTRT